MRSAISGASAAGRWAGRVRPLRPRDAGEVAAVVRSAFAVQPVATDPPPSALGETADAVRVQIEVGGGFGVEAAGRLVGVVLWAPIEGGMRLGRLAVLAGWRGRGIAGIGIPALETPVELMVLVLVLPAVFTGFSA